MASTLDFTQYVADQLAEAGTITFRKMFGEYALYCEGKTIGFVADDRLYLKPTEAALSLLPHPVLQPFYKGGSPYLYIENVDDHGLLVRLVRAAWPHLDFPKPRRKKK